MIIFRIFIGPSSGLGHLTRCLILAKKLQQNGTDVVFIGDVIPLKATPFLAGFSYHSLYKEMPTAWNPIEDAQKFLAHLDSHATVEWVVLDHYFLDAVWEEIVQNQGMKILAIDDLVRSHVCDALVDFKWRGDEAELVYRDKVSPNTQLLLGPQYLLAEIKDLKCDESELKAEQPKILISFGGGGSGQDLAVLIQALIAKFNFLKRTVCLQVVIGPFLTHKECLLGLSQNQGNVEIEWLENKTDLTPYLKACDFYLGAAGGIVYHLRLLKKSALTFSMVSNQISNQGQLDAIGHYLHLNDFQFSQVAPLSELIAKLIDQLSRLKILFDWAQVPLDNLGATRLVNFMRSGQLSSVSVTQDQDFAWTRLAGDYQIRAVQDSDLNHYLASRNLPANCKNMIDSKPIPVMDHYQWWFGTQRHSYLMVKQQKPVLYIWDEVKLVEGESFLIGGWFVCSEQTSFQDAMVALDWQLKHCAIEYPNVPWIAVISRQNKYVKLMNDYFGFKEIDPLSRYSSVVKQLFPQADEQAFYQVYKSSQSDKGDSK